MDPAEKIERKSDAERLRLIREFNGKSTTVLKKELQLVIARLTEAAARAAQANLDVLRDAELFDCLTTVVEGKRRDAITRKQQKARWHG